MSKMKFCDQHILTLSELGLSSTQAKIYLTLTQQRAQTAHAISEASGVERSDVYRVLAQLEKTGLITTIISKPEQFYAISIEEGISNLMERRIEKTAELAHQLRGLANEYKRKDIDEQTFDKIQFVLLPKKAPVYFKAERMLSKTQQCICFLGLTKRMIAWLSNYLPLLEQTLARKVDCKMIMPVDTKNNYSETPFDSLFKYHNFELRLIQKAPTSAFSVWDRKEVLITTCTIDSPTPADTLWSNNKNLVDLSQNYFEYIWADSKKAVL
jgi:sugar-specific transcriptional regulator TrmB